MSPDAQVHRGADLRVGMSAEFERHVTEADITEFARLSGDHNPLHVDAAYAATTNYGQRIAHGAFQVGLASAMLGMYLPGRNALLTLINSQFPLPLRFPTTVRVRGEIAAWNLTSLTGRLKVTVSDVATGAVTADIGLGFSLHEEAHKASSPQPAVANDSQIADRPLVLVTGAAGGIGSQIVRTLSEKYRVLALHNRTPLPEDLGGNPHLRSHAVSLSEADWPASLGEALGAEPLYGIIHCAWPGMPRGGLTSLPTDVVQLQLSYGTIQVIELAKLLATRTTSLGGRMVVLGSIAGSAKPAVSVGAYSLGKSAMEHAVRLLAAELAGKKITVNAISPGFVPVGINQQADSRRIKLESAQVPLGRLCQPQDIANAALWLLSPEASFISGEILNLTGGQL